MSEFTGPGIAGSIDWLLMGLLAACVGGVLLGFFARVVRLLRRG